MNRTLTSIAGLVILLALFFAVNILAGSLLRSSRLDFTQGKLYTLAQGSKNIAKSIDEPITLDLYFSSKLASSQPALATYGKRVRELLEEYQIASHGKIILQVHDPEPFSETEDEAVQYGMQGVPVGNGGAKFYFGLVGSNAVANRTVIPFFDPKDESFLEYEISRRLYALANPTHKVLGMISGLEIGGVMPAEGSTDPGAPAWQIAREISGLFDVRRIDPKSGRIPADLDVLLIIQPKELPDQTLYAIDQYVLAGGRAMIFVDPHSESDPPPDPSDMVASISYKTGSDLPNLFKAWGIAMDPDVVATDLLNAQQVLFADQAGKREPVAYIPWMAIRQDNLDHDDLVTGKISRLLFASPGAIDTLDGATTKVTRLAWTSPQSMRMETIKVRLLPDPKRLTADFKPDGKELTLAVRITGDVKTAFPAGPPEGAPATPEKMLTESVTPINIIVVADTDLLADRFWLQQNAFGSIQKIADNGDFVVNGLDNLSGSSDLIGLRARGSFTRPFARVEDLRAKAEEKYRAQERTLQKDIQDTQQRIDKIRADRPQTADVLSPEVQGEIAQLQGTLLDNRKQLRQVQLNLRQDVESLGVRLKIINTALTPAIVALAAIGLGLYRSTRRRADRRAMAHT